MGASIPSLPTPTFVADADGLDPNLILADMITAFENAAGRVLQPAQVERLLINLYAYREALVRNAIQYAAQQNLLAFSAFPMIDYLGQLVAVTRLAAQPALTTIEFTLESALTVPFTIAAGTPVGTSDGQFIFTTNADLIIPAGAASGSVNATSQTTGSGANGYLAGQINVQLSPNALIASAANTTTSGGGSSPETDDHLRTRIQAAPNQFSVAGPAGAYRFFALGVDPSIVDVLVVSPQPGTVQVYVLTGPVTVQPAAAPNPVGIANSALLEKVAAALSADEVRPLTDTVQTSAVTEVDYVITATVNLYSDADPASTQAAVNEAAAQFAINQALRVQRNIVLSQLEAALSVPGVYEVLLTAPAADLVLTTGQWANCTAINITFGTSAEHS